MTQPIHDQEYRNWLEREHPDAAEVLKLREQVAALKSILDDGLWFIDKPLTERLQLLREEYAQLQSYNEDAQDKAGRLEQQVAALTAENASLRQRLPAHSAIHGAYIADLEQQVAALTAENERLKAEWSIMARACGNWREWPEGAVSKDAPDYTHSDWQVAARAILERDQWKQMAEQLEVKIKKLKDELAEETWKRR